MSPQINFAKAADIESVGGAIAFTILYIPLSIWFLLKSFTNPTHVHYSLALFCQVRVAAFVIRAVLAGSELAGGTLKLVVVVQTLFELGYFSLLDSAYILVLDRMLLTKSPLPTHPILRLTQNRQLFHISIVIALVLGLVSAATTNSDGTAWTTDQRSLHIASTVISLVFTVLQAVQTVILSSKPVSGKGSIVGVRYRNYILVIISLLLLVREIFATATVKNSAKQNNEHFWYPLIAVPEILAVILFSTPGLVPRKEEVTPWHSPASTTAA